MKKCGNCGYEKNKDDKKFCIKCGKPLVHTVENESTVLLFDPIEDEDTVAPVAEKTAAEEKDVVAKIVCSNCGYEKNKDGRKFCIKCGKLLAYTEAKEAVILPFEPIPDEEELVSVRTEESLAENSVAVPTKEFYEEIIAEEPVVVPIEEFQKKKQNPYLKYVIALIGVLIILGVLIIALIPDMEDASELNNAEITTASETTYELTSAETAVTKEQPATVSETTSVTTIPTTATETTTTVPVTTTMLESTTTAETTIESVITTSETTTVPVTTTTVVTTVPKTEASTVKTTVTTTKKETSSAKRELLTPLDKVPTYTRYKMKNGAFYDELDYEFIYDEDVIGEWNLVSVYDGDPSEFDFDKAVPFEEETHIWGKKLFFCSNSMVYHYRFPYKGIESGHQWTLGLICEGMDKTQPIVNEYEIWKIEEKEYLLVKNNSNQILNYSNGKSKSSLNYLIYEKINSDEPIIENDALEIITAIAPVINADDGIERELLTPYDKVLAYERYKINNRGGISERIQPYFFISDEIALGEWNAIDYISIEPSEYDPNVKYSTAYGHNLVFEDNGKFTWKWDKYTSEKSKWTLGLIIAPHGGGGNYVRSYQIWKINGEEYLFCEEDDGICNSTGTKSYHVLKKEE